MTETEVGAASQSSRSTDEADGLREQLRIRQLELESLALELRHVRADLAIKDEYIAVLRHETPTAEAEVAAAHRYLMARARVVAAVNRHPALARAARPVVRRVKKWL